MGDEQQRRINNFDLLRLLAASQVVLVHCIEYLKLPFPRLALDFVYLLPGVPVFFVMSGFLISASLERAGNLRAYVRNRVLRIYPGLWACLILSVLSVLAVRPAVFLTAKPSAVAIWLGAQVSFLQFWNPDFLRVYGNGVLNGGLWTIPVELQFYLVLPILYRWWKLREVKRNDWLLAMAVVLGFLNWHFAVLRETPVGRTIPVKLYGQTFVPHFYMFVLGVLYQRNFEVIHKLVSGRAALWFLLYAPFPYLSRTYGIHPLNPLSLLMLSLFVISCAFTRPTLASRILKGNDISYGTYLYNLPVINMFRDLGFVGQWGPAAGVAVLVYGLAFASWKLLEQPVLTWGRGKASEERAARVASPERGPVGTIPVSTPTRADANG